eukprot:6479855-Amphidinium_carterae.1
MVLGVPLAWAKATQGKTVDWIGASLSSGVKDLSVTIPAKKIEEVRAMLDEMLSQQVASRRSILALAGKLSHMAGLVIYLKPFLSPLWAVAADSARSNGPEPVTTRTPRHLVHVKRIRKTLLWLRAFVRGESASIVRRFHYDEGDT